MTMKKTSHALPVILLIGILFLYYPAVRLPIQMKPIIPGQSVIPRQNVLSPSAPGKNVYKN